MRIAAHVCVKDEVEIIEQTIAHLRAVGVDHIVVVDAYSTDGTAEILERHRTQDDFWVYKIDDLEPDGEEKIWLRRNLEMAKSARADWVLFQDADEMWVPAGGSLKHCASLAAHDIVTVDRFNVVLGADGIMLPQPLEPAGYDRLQMFVDRIPDFRAYLQENPSQAWLRGVPVPKIIARPELIGGLLDGMHDAIPIAGTSPRRADPPDLLIAHLPITTWERFARKVDNIRRVFAVHSDYFGGHMAWHWRRWLAMANEGRLREEYERTIVGPEGLLEYRRSGAVRSAAEVFRQRSSP